MVLNMLSNGGHDETPTAQRVLWAGLIALIASTLLFAGGLSALQTATIASALPFSLAIIGSLWGFYRALIVDGTKRDTVSVHPPMPAEARNWRDRLSNLLVYPEDDSVLAFQRETVAKAMRQFAAELAKHSVTANISDALDERGVIRLEVLHGDEIDFVYEVRCRSHPMPDDSLVAKSSGEPGEQDLFWRAEVHLAEGGQDYCIMGWSVDQVVVDILTQYENHLHFLHTVR
jgi:choline/glycine/proline betaine transport protein